MVASRSIKSSVCRIRQEDYIFVSQALSTGGVLVLAICKGLILTAYTIFQSRWPSFSEGGPRLSNPLTTCQNILYTNITVTVIILSM